MITFNHKLTPIHIVRDIMTPLKKKKSFNELLIKGFRTSEFISPHPYNVYVTD